jgi:hypothetical protein
VQITSNISDSTWTANSPGAITSSLNGITLTKMYWLLGRRSRLSLSNKLLLYKPIWTYGIQLWGTASTSNIEILERFQSKALRLLVDAPWYVHNHRIRRDLQMPSVKEEICRSSDRYYTRLITHLAHLAPPGTTHQAIATTYAQRSAWQIHLIIVVVVILVSKV